MKLNYDYKNAQGQFAPYVLETENGKVINPTAEIYELAGYYPYTPLQPTDEEIAQQARITTIEELKMKLADSDYKTLKYLEGWISEEDYAETKAQRQAWRDRINELEESIGISEE